MNEMEMEAVGYQRVYDYTQYSHDNHVNVITEEAFKHLVTDTFKVITDQLRQTYGPYGNAIMISDQNETTATKDGYNIYNALAFSHQYKKMVYLAIQKIIERVNNNVGDGTTSCILLAEKIFNHLNAIIKTTEDKRNVKKILDNIENSLQSSVELSVDRCAGHIEPLTEKSLNSLLMLASNYDSDLVDTLIDAMRPVCKDPSDPRTPIVSMNNVVVDVGHPYETTSTTYQVEQLPGDYRVRINMDETFALALEKKTKMKVVLYDHTFGISEWENFEQNRTNKDEPVMIIARTFSATFMNNNWVRYCGQRALVKQPVPIYLVEINAGYFQDEIHDLAAALNTKPHTIHDLLINHDELPIVELSVYNYYCLCFYGLTRPEEYIDKLEIKYANEKSYAKRIMLSDRINALQMKTNDAIVTVKAESTLEMKLLSDKLDDCVAIAKSALEYGIVPNLLCYGYHRILRVYSLPDPKRKDTLEDRVVRAICDSITEIADDIFTSKHNTPTEEEAIGWNKVKVDLYTSEVPESYDIVDDCFVEIEELPTSAQYDMEILIASISIVKYILSARALIFDAHLMASHGDEGHFKFVNE